MSSDLSKAIDRQEFSLHFQPIVHCESGRPVSLEALIRWEHPLLGCLPPAAFLRQLFEQDLMGKAGRWVVAEACRQAVEWQGGSAVDVPVAINVSPRQLCEPDFVSDVCTIMWAAGADVRMISFEITEDIELDDCAGAMRGLRELRAAGFAVRIDDFGTGYSSLSYLQRLPVSGIKLDRAFIRDIEHDARHRAVVNAVIRLAHVLGMDLVAEGVERAGQLDALRDLRCDHAQGFLLSPPLAAADVPAWLARQGGSRALQAANGE